MRVSVYLCTFRGLFVVAKQLRVEVYTQHIIPVCIWQFLQSQQQLLWLFYASDLFDQFQQYTFAGLCATVEVATTEGPKVREHKFLATRMQHIVEVRCFVEGWGYQL